MIVTVFLLLALGVVIWGVVSFNGLVRLRNQVRTAWADIDVQLKRRHDLVPQLCAQPDDMEYCVCAGYAEAEHDWCEWEAGGLHVCAARGEQEAGFEEVAHV